MRTTIDIPEDLHRIATSLARHNKRSLGQTVAELMRRGLEVQPQAERIGEPRPLYRVHSATGLPVIDGGTRPITDDDVKAIEDEW